MSEIPTIECACGFKVSGPIMADNVDAYDRHECPSAVETAPSRWHDNLFSFWGWVTIGTVVFLIGLVVEDWLLR